MDDSTMAKERLVKTGERAVVYEQFPGEWCMTDEEMMLLFHEAETHRTVYGDKYPWHRDVFAEKVRLAKKYIAQFWAEPIPQQWLDDQEMGKQQHIATLRAALDEVGGDYALLDVLDKPGGWIRFDAGVVSPVATHLVRSLEDFRHPEIEHPRLRAIRYMDAAARVMAAAGDTMAIPQADYVKFVMQKEEDFGWDSGRQGGAVGDYSLQGAPWGPKNGLPISIDEYDDYTYRHTYADFFPGAPQGGAPAANDQPQLL